MLKEGGGGSVRAGVWGLQCVWIVVSTQPLHHQHNNKTSLCIICLIQGGWGVVGVGGVYPLCSPTASLSVSHDISGENYFPADLNDTCFVFFLVVGLGASVSYNY